MGVRRDRSTILHKITQSWIAGGRKPHLVDFAREQLNSAEIDGGSFTLSGVPKVEGNVLFFAVSLHVCVAAAPQPLADAKGVAKPC